MKKRNTILFAEKKHNKLALTRHIPNLLTSLNLLTGCIGITIAFQGMLPQAAWCIGIAVVLDYADGFAARSLNAYTSIGKEMDSFADLVSFGVLPGMILFLMAGNADNEITGIFNDNSRPYWHFAVFLIPVFSALRLARFNTSAPGGNHFTGLPTPSNALFTGALPLIETQNYQWITQLLNTPSFLVVTAIILSFFLISPFFLFSLKFKSYGYAENKIRYLFLTTSLVLIISLGYLGIPLTIIWYIVLSLITRASWNHELSSRN